jgi:UrcA family protein
LIGRFRRVTGVFADRYAGAVASGTHAPEPGPIRQSAGKSFLPNVRRQDVQKLIMTAALGFAALLPVQAEAQPGERYIVAIPVSDLNLGNPAGAKALRGRAMRSAREVCGEAEDLSQVNKVYQCRAEFMAQVENHITLAQANGQQTLARR